MGFDKFSREIVDLGKGQPQTPDLAGTIFDGPNSMDPTGTIFDRPIPKRKEFRCENCNSTVMSWVCPGTQCPFCQKETHWSMVPCVPPKRNRVGFQLPEVPNE